MSRLQDTYVSLPPILQDGSNLPLTHYTPDTDSTDVDAARCTTSSCDLDLTLLQTFHHTEEEDLSDRTFDAILSPLTFHTGRLRGQQCSYSGYIYTHNKSRRDGHRYWNCKDRRKYKPPCKGRLSTLGTATVTKETPHSHPPSFRDVEAEQFLSKIRTDNTDEAAAIYANSRKLMYAKIFDFTVH